MSRLEPLCDRLAEAFLSDCDLVAQMVRERDARMMPSAPAAPLSTLHYSYDVASMMASADSPWFRESWPTPGAIDFGNAVKRSLVEDRGCPDFESAVADVKRLTDGRVLVTLRLLHQGARIGVLTKTIGPADAQAA